MNSLYETHISEDAAPVLGLRAHEIDGFIHAAIAEHGNLVNKGGSDVLKNAPESAVTIVKLQDRPAFCVKELRWRGWLHAMKSLFRASQGLRTFQNAHELNQANINSAKALILARRCSRGLIRREWVIMEVVESTLELDRYVLKRSRSKWSHTEKTLLVSALARFLGGMHAKGIFHADMKTCNLLVRSKESTLEPEFFLLDYDAVEFGSEVSFRNRVKNLVQLFLSSPIEFNAVDRLRFLQHYAAYAGVSSKERHNMAQQVLAAVKGNKILYVGFSGDIVEDWE